MTMKRLLAFLVLVIVACTLLSGQTSLSGNATLGGNGSLGASSSGGPTWTYINKTECANNPSPCTANFGGGVNAGDLIVASVGISPHTSAAGISDGTSSFTCTTTLANTNFGDDYGSSFCYLLSSVATGNPTYTVSQTGGQVNAAFFQFRPGSAVSLDFAPTGSAYGCDVSPESSPTGTPNYTDLVFGVALARDSGTALPSITIAGSSPTATEQGLANFILAPLLGYLVTSGSGVTTATFTTGCENINVQIIGFHQ